MGLRTWDCANSLVQSYDAILFQFTITILLPDCSFPLVAVLGKVQDN